MDRTIFTYLILFVVILSGCNNITEEVHTPEEIDCEDWAESLIPFEIEMQSPALDEDKWIMLEFNWKDGTKVEPNSYMRMYLKGTPPEENEDYYYGSRSSSERYSTYKEPIFADNGTIIGFNEFSASFVLIPIKGNDSEREWAGERRTQRKFKVVDFKIETCYRVDGLKVKKVV